MLTRTKILPHAVESIAGKIIMPRAERKNEELQYAHLTPEQMQRGLINRDCRLAEARSMVEFAFRMRRDDVRARQMAEKEKIKAEVEKEEMKAEKEKMKAEKEEAERKAQNTENMGWLLSQQAKEITALKRQKKARLS